MGCMLRSTLSIPTIIHNKPDGIFNQCMPHTLAAIPSNILHHSDYAGQDIKFMTKQAFELVTCPLLRYTAEVQGRLRGHQGGCPENKTLIPNEDDRTLPYHNARADNDKCTMDNCPVSVSNRYEVDELITMVRRDSAEQDCELTGGGWRCLLSLPCSPHLTGC